MVNPVSNGLKRQIERRERIIHTILHDEYFMENASNILKRIITCFKNGNKLAFCGNGGSAADCEHIVAEFVVKLTKYRRALPAIALSSNNSIITAISNDMDYNYVFARQVEGVLKSGDILVGISTSGKSQNIIAAIEYANKHNIYTIAVTGSDKSKLRGLANDVVVIPSNDTQVVQEMYMMFFHSLCEKIEDCFSSDHNKYFS